MPYVAICDRWQLRTRPFATEAELEAHLESKRPKTLNPEEIHANPLIARFLIREHQANRHWCPGCDQDRIEEVSKDELEFHDWYYFGREALKGDDLLRHHGHIV